MKEDDNMSRLIGVLVIPNENVTQKSLFYRQKIMDITPFYYRKHVKYMVLIPMTSIIHLLILDV